MKWMTVDAKGQITSQGTCPDGMDVVIPGAYKALTGMGDEIDQRTHYHDGVDFVPFGEKPSEFHVWDWGVYAWTPDSALAERSVRAKRDKLLAESDWTQLPDVPALTQVKWQGYRQALRDVTLQVGFPFSVEWPAAPQ